MKKTGTTASNEPSERNPVRTRLAIIDAATEEFAALGLGGARIDAIAARAGTNKRMLYYYFGNKEDLFQAVLERVYDGIRTAEKGLHLDALDPATAIRELVSFTWHYYLEHPEFITLLNSENLHQGVHLKDVEAVQRTNFPLVDTLDRILDQGKKNGTFRSGVDPVQLYISIAGLSYFYLSNNHTLSTIFARDLMQAKAKSERLSHMTDLILGYLLR